MFADFVYTSESNENCEKYSTRRWYNEVPLVRFSFFSINYWHDWIDYIFMRYKLDYTANVYRQTTDKLIFKSVISTQR